jgi:DHA1 family quinolone resistance protein-like MFS transporter
MKKTNKVRIPIISDIKDMDKTLKLLIISDILVYGALGFIGPILSIFIDGNLQGGGIFTAGLASTIFLLTHAVLQLVFSYFFNPKDRLWMLKIGTAIIALVPVAYIFSTHICHLFIAEFIYGVGAALAYPSWSSLFTAHLKEGERGFQWSVYSSGLGIGTAITAALGGLIAQTLSFKVVFLMTSILGLIGMSVLFGLEKKALKKT